MSLIINKNTEVAVLPKGGNIHRSTDVRVQSAQMFRCDIMSSLEGSACHLPLNASHAIEVLGIIGNIRNPICKGFSDHQLEGIFSRVHEMFVEEVKGSGSG